MRRHQTQTPVLITGAPVSPAVEFAARQRRYSLIMFMRIPCLVLAGVAAIGFGWTTLAAVLVIASVPLPWIAVLVANDGPVRKAEPVARYRPGRQVAAPTTRALGTSRVIEAPVAEAGATDARATDAPATETPVVVFPAARAQVVEPGPDVRTDRAA